MTARDQTKGRIGGIWAGFSTKVRDEITRKVQRGASFEAEVEKRFEQEMEEFEERRRS